LKWPAVELAVYTLGKSIGVVTEFTESGSHQPSPKTQLISAILYLWSLNLWPLEPSF